MDDSRFVLPSKTIVSGNIVKYVVTLCILFTIVLVAGCATTEKSLYNAGSVENLEVTQVTEDEAILMLINDANWFSDVILSDPEDQFKSTLREKLKSPNQAYTLNEVEEKTLLTLDSNKRKKYLNSLNKDDKKKVALIVQELEKAKATFCSDKIPLVYTIGTQSKLVLPEPKEGEAVIKIPIEARNLDPNCVGFYLSIVGPTYDNKDNKDTYFSTKPPTTDNPDYAELILKEKYLNILKTGSEIEVHIAISQKYKTKNYGRVVSYGSRKFTFYKTSDYEKEVLNSRVRSKDIEAFPLPDEEVLKLYGPLISRDYFVVDLSIRNRTNMAKLVSTGMVIASGRAIVCPAWRKKYDDEEIECGKEIIFSVPISVVPRSAALMYTVLDDEEVEQPRAKFFRHLEFIGAIASAVTTAYSGIDATQAANLFSGVFIPAAKKALPDRWPGFKRNIVNNAFPDLLKIPANSVSGHKHLFFSKSRLSSVVGDHLLFSSKMFQDKGALSYKLKENFSNTSYLATVGIFDFRELDQEQIYQGIPNVKVVSLGFENLEIPFEEVVENPDDAKKIRFNYIQIELPLQISKLKSINQTTERLIFGTSVVIKKDLNTLRETMAKISKQYQNSSKLIDKKMIEAVNLADKIAQSLTNENKDSGYEFDLLSSNSNISLSRLEEDTKYISILTTQILAGITDENLLNKINSELDSSIAMLSLYEFTAQKLMYLSTSLNKVMDNDDDKIKFTQQIGRLLEQLQDLKENKLKPFKVQPNLTMISDWSKVKTFVDSMQVKLELSVSTEGDVKVITEKSEDKICNRAKSPCGYSFYYGTNVEIVPVSKKATWGGNCTNDGTCKLILDQDKAVTAELK